MIIYAQFIIDFHLPLELWESDTDDVNQLNTFSIHTEL